MIGLPLEFSGFFEHARNGHLCFPFCGACHRFHWYPMPRCPHCRSTTWYWQRVSAVGEIYSFTNVRHAFDPSRRQALPYVVALVTFAEAPGIRLITNIVDVEAPDLRIGQRLQPVFPAPDDGTGRILFRTLTDKGSAVP